MRRCHGRRGYGIVGLADAADRLGVDRRNHDAFDAGASHAVEERPCLARRLGRANFAKQRIESGLVAEFDAGGIAPLRAVKVARQGNLRVARVARVADAGLRTLEQRRDRHRGIGGNRHEGGIRAVFQETPHEISQKIAMAADRSVDPARRFGVVGEQEPVEHLAHAVQSLELVAFDAAGIFDHARHGERVVGGELRVEPRPRREQLARAGGIAQVGHGLAREHGIVGETALLRALDLGIPVGALDQPHRQAAAQPARGFVQPIDHRRSALLIGLHREPEAVPAAQRDVGEHGFDHVEREFEPVGLLGIHGEIEVEIARLARKLERPRHQFGQDTMARHRLEPRMQGRELDRNAGPAGDIAGARGDGIDGMGIGGEIALRVGCRARALTQHVEGIAQRRLRAGALERFLDRLSEHEMRAQEPHPLPRGGAHGGNTEAFDETLENRIRGLAGMDDAGGDAERPGRGRNEQRARFDVVRGPIAGGELVFDQPVGGGGIGHPQQRLRQHHEGEPLLGGQRIGMEEILDAAEPAGPGPDPLDEAPGIDVDSPFGVPRTSGLTQQSRRDLLVGRRIGSPEEGWARCIRGQGCRLIWDHDRLAFD